MIRRLLTFCVLFSLLVSLTPVATSKNQRSGPDRVNVDQGSWLAGLESYAAPGRWLIEKLMRRGERQMTVAPPVTALLSPPPFFLDAPANLSVTATSDTSVNLSWTAPGGALSYRIERSQNVSGPFLFLANTSNTTYNDTTVSADQAYLYRVRAVGSGGVVSTPSNMALGTAITFEFSSLAGNIIKAQHIYDIRTAVNAVRAVASLSAATWTRTTLAGLTVQANDVQELRTKLGEGLSALSISVAAYTDPTLTPNSTLIKAVHLEELQTRSTRGSSTSSGPTDSDSSTARLDPMNDTGGGGENPLSRNFNWTLPLVNLPGRAGLDLSLSLSYNSLVWTKNSSFISFDDDHGFPGPGFRLGFPVIQPLYYNAEVGKNAYLLIGTDGRRTELRQVGTSALYEAADSSHILLDSSTMILRTIDGTQMTYVAMGSEFNCTQIKDRNGNYLTINYTAFGRIDTVVDTLARSIKFNYDANGWLTSITQLWNAGATTQYWARFAYTDTTINTNFSVPKSGPPNQSTIKTLQKVTLADDSHYDFSYTSYGQIWKVSSFAADNHLLNYRSYNLPQTMDPQVSFADCPRFTERYDWAQYWNGDTDGNSATNEEAITTFALPTGDTWTMPDNTQRTGTRTQVTAPDGTNDKIYFVGTAGTSSGWQRRLPALVNTYEGTTLRRQVMKTWTQDNTSLSYPLNPRVLETNTYDPSGNRARVETTYQQVTFANGTSCQLLRDVYEYAANASTKIRSTRIDYNTSTTYTDRRIIGLVSERRLYEGDVNNGGTLAMQVGYFYDESGSVAGADAPVQHDNTSYSSSFVAGRGNISSVRRYNVNNTSQYTTTTTKYNTAGAVVSLKDALNHETQTSYADSFSDNNNSRNTLAYATTITDPDGYTSISKYNFDFGAETYSRTPQPDTTQNQAGPEETHTFDSIGRPLQDTNVSNGSYTRYVYSTTMIKIEVYTSPHNGVGEAYAVKWTDGAGRVIGAAAEHPGSVGGYSGQRFVYNVMGRTIKTSNPMETSASGVPLTWTTAGDDAGSAWIYREQTYDWKGRPLVTTNADLTTRTLAYTTCGCAGGDVVTSTDEGTIDGGVAKRRQEKMYSDVLGRPVKKEMLNWQGGSVYSSVVTTYNARDQVTLTRQYAGAEGSGTYQDTTMAYDGYGRLQSRHVPEQNINTATVWTYNADDTVNTVTDARGAVTTFGYTGNNRHLVENITHTLTGLPTLTATFDYDAAGNRTYMSDGAGSVTYTHNQLSQVTAETRTITGVGSFTLNYGYNGTGDLTSITDPFGASVSYTYDKVGRLNAVNGANYASVSTYASSFQYRAWGALKSLSYGNTRTLAVGYDANLNVSTYEVDTLLKKAYQYYDDGKLKFTQDQLITDSKYDRFYAYDHVGRTITALSGAEARGGGPTDDRPYKESMTYDAFGHLTLRDIRQWDRDDSMGPDTYTNNRRDFWSYDADGRLLSGSTMFTYDAAGFISSFGDGDPFSTDQQLDGDGERIKTVLRKFNFDTNQWTTQKTTYYIRSSVLDQVITEVGPTAAKERTYVFAGGNLLAVQTSSGSTQSVNWEHTDASGASQRKSNSTGAMAGGAERDPFGANAGLVKPFTWTPPTGRGELIPFYTVPDMNGPLTGCVLDGIPTPCSMISMEAATPCPDNDCGPRTVVLRDRDGRVVDTILTNPFRSFADGHSGFELAGTTYVGDGLILNSWWTGGAPEKITFDQLGYGSLAQAFMMNFISPQGKGKEKKPKRRRSIPRTTDLPRGLGALGIALAQATPRVFGRPIAKVEGADYESRSGIHAPCAEEEEAVMDAIASSFGGTFNDFRQSDGATGYDWEFHFNGPITVARMREVMGGQGFQEFTNMNIKDHGPTYGLGYGSYHWMGNVNGNWYHIEFKQVGILPNSNNVEIRRGGNGAHYEPDRPDSPTHRKSIGPRNPC